MKRLLGILLFAPMLACANGADDRFMSAREAFRKGERMRLAQDVVALRGDELLPWAEYWQLRLKIDDAQTDGVPAFLDRQAGNYLADKLRGDWLRALGKKGEWELFEQEYPKLVQPEQDVACYALQARLARRQDGSALDEARPLWFSLLDMPAACMPLMERLVADKRIDADEAWERVRRLLEAHKLKEAKEFGRFLPAGQEPNAKTLDAIAERPAHYIVRLPANFAATRLEREMALFAIDRMARNDPAAAAVQWQDIEPRFPPAERAYAWGQLAWQAAFHHLPVALGWYERAAQAGPAQLTDEQRAWKVRAALRAGNWDAVRRAIEQMPPQQAHRSGLGAIGAAVPWPRRGMRKRRRRCT